MEIESIKRFLSGYKNKTIELRDLQEVFSSINYGTLASYILEFIEQGVLIGQKEKNHMQPALPKKYRINVGKLQGSFFHELRSLQMKRHPLINLDAYYKLGEETLQSDLLWIEKIEIYLATRDLLEDRKRGIPLPEASYHMVGNEKWIEEEGGEKVLKRLGLTFELLGLVTVPEPLMYAVNPKRFHTAPYKHLIIENKTTYHALLGRFQEQGEYSTLIFGRGKMIISSIQRFYQQTGLDPQSLHEFVYFGDLDTEGIGIWHLLSKNVPIYPAVDLYRKLLQKPQGPGKEYHRPQPESVEAFCLHFEKEEAQRIRTMLNEGHYLPQEAVMSQEWEAYWGQKNS